MSSLEALTIPFSNSWALNCTTRLSFPPFQSPQDSKMLQENQSEKLNAHLELVGDSG